MGDPEQNVTVIGIAGASGSGKSFFAEKLKKALCGQSVVILSQDYYYHDKTEIPLPTRQTINYDHPDAIDFQLFRQQLENLKKRIPVDHPVYDFSTHNRTAETIRIEPADIVIVDGILIYAVPALLELFDLKVYVETPMDICLARRLERDVQERGRTVESVITQYFGSVRPMFLEYVSPSQKHADIVVYGLGEMKNDVERVINTIYKKLN